MNLHFNVLPWFFDHWQQFLVGARAFTIIVPQKIETDGSFTSQIVVLSNNIRLVSRLSTFVVVSFLENYWLINVWGTLLSFFCEKYFVKFSFMSLSLNFCEYSISWLSVYLTLINKVNVLIHRIFLVFGNCQKVWFWS